MSRAISGGAFGVLAIAVSALLIGSVAKPDPAPEQAVQAVVKQALNDIYDAATFKFPDWKRGPLDPSRVAEMHRGLDERLSKSMTGRAYLSYATTLHQTIDTNSSGENVVVTAGGVDQVDFHRIILDGNRATVSGRAHAWVTWVILKEVTGDRAARPAGWEQFAATLELIDGAWFVSYIEVRPEGI